MLCITSAARQVVYWYVVSGSPQNKDIIVKEMDFLYILFFFATTPTLRVC